MRQGRGRKHIPTAESRRFVEEMAAAGINETRIGSVLDIGETALRRYYREELGKAAIRADHLVGRTLFMQATGGGEKGDWKQAVPACTISGPRPAWAIAFPTAGVRNMTRKGAG